MGFFRKLFDIFRGRPVWTREPERAPYRPIGNEFDVTIKGKLRESIVEQCRSENRSIEAMLEAALSVYIVLDKRQQAGDYVILCGNGMGPAQILPVRTVGRLGGVGPVAATLEQVRGNEKFRKITSDDEPTEEMPPAGQMSAGDLNASKLGAGVESSSTPPIRWVCARPEGHEGPCDSCGMIAPWARGSCRKPVESPYKGEPTMAIPADAIKKDGPTISYSHQWGRKLNSWLGCENTPMVHQSEVGTWPGADHTPPLKLPTAQAVTSDPVTFVGSQAKILAITIGRHLFRLASDDTGMLVCDHCGAGLTDASRASLLGPCRMAPDENSTQTAGKSTAAADPTVAAANHFNETMKSLRWDVNEPASYPDPGPACANEHLYKTQAPQNPAAEGPNAANQRECSGGNAEIVRPPRDFPLDF